MESSISASTNSDVMPTPSWTLAPSSQVTDFLLPHVTINELRESAFVLNARPTHELIWRQQIADLLSVVKFQQENNFDVTTTLSLVRLVEYLKDEMSEVRKASMRVLFEVLDVKEHEEMLRRKKLEQTRARTARAAARTAKRQCDAHNKTLDQEATKSTEETI